MLVVSLYVGQGVFVPLVLAVLLAFALSPVVAGLRRIGLPNVPATMAAVAIAGLLVAGIGYVVVTQLLKLAVDLPQYQTTIADKVRAFQQSTGSGNPFERLAEAAGRLEEQSGLGAPKPGTASNPLPVSITNVPPSPLVYLQGLLGSLLGPLATGAIVSVLVIFLLLQREDLRDRFLRLVSRGDLRTSTKVINESASRVSRYLFVQFLVNSVYGVVFGIGLMLLGVPNAILWGLFATLFRYIPFVGTLIAVTIPIVLSFAVDPGWTMLAGVVGLYLVIELTTTNAIEPRLYGSSTGLSALAVLVAAIFWATLWGPVGLLLATPLTVCLVVLGRYVPRLAFLEILLGSDPVLTSSQRFYQRLLARNTEEAIDMAASELANGGLVQFFDSVSLPALRLAEADLEADGSDLGPRRAIVETLNEVVEEVASVGRTPTAIGANIGKILAIGGKTELDTGSAEMLAKVLEDDGIAVGILPPISVRREGLGQIDLSGVGVVCLCYMGTNPKSFVRYAAKRLKARREDLRILACLFNIGSDVELTPADLGVDAVAKSIKTALTQARDLLGVPDESDAANTAAHRVEQLETLRKLERDTRHGGWLDDFLVEVATTFDIPLATANIMERVELEDAEIAPTEWKANALSDEIVKSGEPLVIEDVAAHRLYRDNPFLLENGIQFFAGVPLIGDGGGPLGSLSVVDVRPRSFSPAQIQELQALAVQLMVRVMKPEERRPFGVK